MAPDTSEQRVAAAERALIEALRAWHAPAQDNHDDWRARWRNVLVAAEAVREAKRARPPRPIV